MGQILRSLVEHYSLPAKMSSHHFVKEGQEPALYIHDAVDFSQIEALLEWAPVVITRASQAERIINWGIKVDVVLMDVQDAVPEDLLRSQYPVRMITVSAGSGIVSSVREILHADHQRNITIAAADAQSVLTEWQAAGLDAITVIDTSHRWLGINRSFSKWLPVSTMLILLPSQGSYRIEGAQREGNILTTSSDGVVSVHSPDFFWIGELL
jgi:hypothetical protein